MNYCPVCGALTVKDTSNVYIRCLNCGWYQRVDGRIDMTVQSPKNGTYFEDKPACQDCSRLKLLCAEAGKIIKRYREETPLGNQPHMIAHVADDLLKRLKDEGIGNEPKYPN